MTFSSSASRRFATVLLLLWMTSACATQITIASSPPGADVYSGAKKLGSTPLDLSSSQIEQPTAGGYLIRLERQGFHRLWVWVPEGMRGMNVAINMQPFAETEKQEARALSRSQIDSITATFLSTQHELLLKGAADEKQIQSLLSDLPDLGASHYLAAINHLRRGDKAQALASVKLAIKYSPAEPDYVVLYRELGGDPVADAAAASVATQAADGPDSSNNKEVAK